MKRGRTIAAPDMNEPLPQPIEAHGATLRTRRDLGAFVVGLPKKVRDKNVWVWVADKIMTGPILEAESAFRFARYLDRDARPEPPRKRKKARGSRS